MSLDLAFALAHDAVEMARAAAHTDDDSSKTILAEIAAAKMRHAEGIADFHPVADLSSFVAEEERMARMLDHAAVEAWAEGQDELAVWLETCANAARVHVDWLRDLT